MIAELLKGTWDRGESRSLLLLTEYTRRWVYIMQFWGKLFAAVLGLIALVVAGLLVSLFLNILPLLTVQIWMVHFTSFFTQHWFFQFLGVLLAAFFVFLALLLFRFLLPRPDRTVLYHTPEGDIKVSYNSISSLAKEALRNTSDILSMEADVEKAGNSARLFLRLGVKSHVSVSDFSPMVQQKVREKIERHTGITLKDVKLLIDLQSQDQPANKPESAQVAQKKEGY